MNYEYCQNPCPGSTSYRARKIATEVLGKPLPSQAVIHHVNGDATNNKHSNLVVCEDAAYHGLLHRRTNNLLKYKSVHKPKSQGSDKKGGKEHKKGIGLYRL